MTDYYDPADRAHTADYKRQTPEILAAWDAFDSAVFARDPAEGEPGPAVPLRYRELMAIAVALTTQCAYCLDWHTRAAEQAGATKKELAEAAWVATAVRAGGAFAHGRMMFKLSSDHSHG